MRLAKNDCIHGYTMNYVIIISNGYYVQFMGMKDQYQEVIDYLFRQLPMFQRQGPMAFKKDLTNILALSEALGNPHRRFPTIHIAGTNGKGSTAHMLSAALQGMGL